MNEKKPEEREVKRLKTKVIYHYVDLESGIEVKSKEVFLKSRKIVHFPFNTKNGRQKYESIQKITYENMPDSLPAGFLKAPSRGYGFTRELSPLLYKLQDELPKLKHIIVSGSRTTQLKNQKEVVLSYEDLKTIRPHLASTQNRHRTEISVAANNELARILPSQFKAEKSKYSKGQLAEFISSRHIRPTLLAEEDISAVSLLISGLSDDHPFIRKGKILITKESVDRLLIDDLIRDYEKLLKQKTETRHLEDKWQKFFSKNILYFNFGYVMRFEKESVQGDKKLNIPDFILLNTFGYLDFFEIKTHLTQLVTFDKGRKNFYWTSDAAKAVTQVENYIDSLTKEEDTVIKNIRDEYGVVVDAVRPYAYIIASSRKNIGGEKTSIYQGKMQKKLWNDFRRLNNSLKNIDFILYDELLDSFRNLRDRLSND